MSGLLRCVGLSLLILASSSLPSRAADRPSASVLSDYFPPPEEQGGWRTLLPAQGEPDDSQKAKIREVGGVDWDTLKAAWDHNAAAPGATGLLVIRRGQIVGEWYKDADRSTAFNIYSSSKSYTSTAYGLILSDFGNGPLPGGKTLVSRHQGLQRRVAPRVAAAARPAQGGDHRAEPPEHGLRPGHAEPAGGGSSVRVGTRPRRRLADGQAPERPRHGLPLQQRGGRPPGARVPSGDGRGPVSLLEAAAVRPDRRDAVALEAARRRRGGRGRDRPVQPGI